MSKCPGRKHWWNGHDWYDGPDLPDGTCMVYCHNCDASYHAQETREEAARNQYYEGMH